MLDEPKPYRTALLIAVVLIAAGLAGEYYLTGMAGTQKLATALAMPVGVIWLMLFVAAVATWVRGRVKSALMLTTAFVILTAAGNEYLAGRAVRTLEGRYAEMAADDASLPEVAVVLGGSVWQTPNGLAEVNGSGDRVVHAARLFHAGRIQRIHCTGTAPPEVSRLSEDEAELTRQLLTDLAVPADVITLGPGGNTSEELAAITTAVEEGTLPVPVGVITSAWHMPRVERLAKASGLEIVPIPADFKSPPPSPVAARVLSVVPTAGALSLCTTVAKEYLAGAVKR